MKIPTLSMTERTHGAAFQYLYPGDGLEAAGVFLCSQGSGRYHQRLVVNEFVGLPYELSERHENSVTWPFEAYFSPERVNEIDRQGKSIITVHSHPSGQPSFSHIDNDNDQEQFRSVNAWFDDERMNGAAVMLPDGSIVVRAVLGNGQFRNFKSVNVVGDTIRIWKERAQASGTAYGKKLSQTLGQGTLDQLRALKIGVVGCSGTGSIVIELLVRNCVGELVVVDNDVLEEKNLNRFVNGTIADARRKRRKLTQPRKRLRESVLRPRWTSTRN